jgi:hypothetical protein
MVAAQVPEESWQIVKVNPAGPEVMSEILRVLSKIQKVIAQMLERNHPISQGAGEHAAILV